MPFISDILRYDSLSVIGLAKNTGKTECLNYLLNRLPKITLALTSIGIDGESTDQVTNTAKPEISLKKGMLFATSESHYRKRRIHSELLDISEERTSIGRVVTARALAPGKILLSGPSSTYSLKRWISRVKEIEKVDLIVIDGALSRLSHASPTVSKSMILATGAAFSANIDTLVRKTAFVVELIKLPESELFAKKDLDITISEEVWNRKGIWRVYDSGEMRELNISSAFEVSVIDESILDGAKALFISGALTDRFLNMVRAEMGKGIEIIVTDFTKIFVSPVCYNSFIKRGGRITVLKNSELIAVCVNPYSPNGMVLDSDVLCNRISEAIKLPVYDIVKNRYEA